MSSQRPAAALVLAAGKGTRMKSELPKVLHGFAGRSLLAHVLAALSPLQVERTVVVLGHGREEVAATLPSGVASVVQAEQRGTGHAVAIALEALEDVAEDSVILVLSGDTPLLRSATLAALLAKHNEFGAAATVLTARLSDPAGYGRIVRAGDGSVTRIVEHRDADEPTRAIDEINTGTYAFTAGPLRKALTLVGRDNSQGEQYLTDVVAILRDQGLVVAADLTADAAETAGINDKLQLADAARVYNARLVEQAMLDGVTVQDPLTTWLDATVRLQPDVTLLPGTRLHGTTSVMAGATIGPDTTMTDTVVGAGARVQSSTCNGAKIGARATVGPYSYLRPGAVLGEGSKVGAFVEIKKTTIGAGSKVPHLSYIGDATIGDRVNLGAGTITSNYDGVDKHPTTIGDDVFTGCDTILVPPVTLHDAAYTAAGSVITDDVPEGALGVGRARQQNIEGWVTRKRSTKPQPEKGPA